MSLIAVWSGSVANIPAGWKLCNGSDGTPDLRNKFIRGAYSDATRPPKGTGGAATHTHTISSAGAAHTHTVSSEDSHRHFVTLVGQNPGWARGTFAGNVYTDYKTHSHTSSSSGGSHTHTTSAESLLPPYYTLAFIVAEEENYDFPEGAIIMWSGSIATIPVDWQFCNGSGGSPDLRDKFVRGAYSAGTRPPGTTGGGSHSHAQVNDGSHTHTSASTNGAHTHSTYETAASNGFQWHATGRLLMANGGSSHTHTLASAGGHTHTVSNDEPLPSYYNLAFIMKKAA